MNLISGFFAANMVLVFFINGLAFFVMGLAISFETRRPSKLKLAESLWLLATFAFLRSLANWLEMFLLIRGQAALASVNLPLQTAKALLLPLSCMFLLQFGTKMIIAANRRHLWLRWVPLALLSIWLLALIWAVYSSSGGSAERPLAADVWARYLLYLPGSALSGLAVCLHSRVFQEMKLPHIARDCIGAAAAFWLKAIVAGLIVSPAPYFPAFYLNESSFLAAVGVPVQVFRTITTLAFTYFIVRILRVFEIEQNRQLEAATQQRLRAQQQALEAERQTREEIELWSKRLEDVVNTIAVAISKPLELKEMLDTALYKILDLTRFEAGEIFLVQEGERELALIKQIGLPGTMIHCGRTIKLGEGITEDIHTSGETIVVRNIHEDSRLQGMPCQEAGFRVLVSVPVKCRGNVLGVMNLLSKGDQTPTANELGVLAAVGQQIGVAIENARLYEQVQSIAVLEERDRLARELHDRLAQALGYLNVKASITDELLSGGQINQAQASLFELKEIAKETYTDVREAIFGLRTTTSSELGCLPALREYLTEYRAHYGVDARLVVDSEGSAQLSPDVSIQLLRIIQEALVNVRKHAEASQVWVRFGQDGARARITVEDDGRGFDLAQVDGKGQRYFGLQIMRERAESIGGDVALDSRPGQGTRVVIRVPLTPQR